MMLSRQAEAVVLVVVAAAVEDSAVQVEVVADSAVVEAVVAQTEGESSFLFSCVCWRIWCAKNFKYTYMYKYVEVQNPS